METGRERWGMKACHVSMIAAMLMATAVGSRAVDVDPGKDVAAQAIERLGREMRKKLTDTLQKNGPAEAVNVCAKDAPAIISRIESELGVTMKRTSLKLRNPRNAPDAAEKNVLESLAALHRAGGKLPQGVTVFPDDPHRFYKTIMVEKTCLACHGDPTTMSEAVRRELAATYPDDRAVGYREGDFRGIVSVTVK